MKFDKRTFLQYLKIYKAIKLALFLLNHASMLPFSLSLLLIWVLKDLNLLNLIANLSQALHQSCKSHVGMSSEWYPIYSALTCGTGIYNFQFFNILKTQGLVHLFVLSGAHIVFAETVLNHFTQCRKKLFGSLLILTLITGLTAPAVRALIHWCTRELSLRKELNWSRSLCIGVTGLLCLGLNPHWWMGLSLALSWVASLSFLLFPKSRIKSFISVYLLSLPLLASLQVANPFSILMNILFSPIFFSFHFPLSWLAGIFPSLQIFVDPIWTYSFDAFQLMNVNLNFQIQPLLTTAEARWTYVFSVQALCYVRERFR